MKVSIDKSLCDGFADCVWNVPEVFELGADAKSRVLDPEPDASLHERVREAAAVCPKSAIRIED